MSTPPTKAHLASEAYATDEPLAVRIETHRLYSVPPVDLPAWVLDRHAWRGEKVVLDIGTGTGQYLAPLRERLPRGRLIGADLAPGMLHDLHVKGGSGGAMLLNADAEALPLATASCDAVVASYVLFFVPDIPRTLAEIQRVLRPGGTLLAVTMADVYMDELRLAINRALEKLAAWRATSAEAPPRTRWGYLQQRFSLDNGPAQLEPYFARITRYQHESALVFPQPEPVLAYVSSLYDVLRDDLHAFGGPSRSWQEFLEVLRDVVAGEIAAHGAFRVSKTAGVLVAIKP